MLLRANPNVAVAPLAQLAQFLYFGMRVLQIVLLGEAGRVIHSDIAAQAEEDTCCLKGQETRVRPDHVNRKDLPKAAGIALRKSVRSEHFDLPASQTAVQNEDTQTVLGSDQDLRLH
jgi:hypothetical protein